jgi:prepilin-type N-terminal cleavage/methylation domain-containing protein
MHRRTAQSRTAGRHGFTLVEVMVTMVMMAIVLPVVMRGISGATNAASFAKHSAEASMLGEQLLNEMTLVLANGETFTYGSSGEFGDGVYKWTLQNADDTELGVTTLMLGVVWNERGQERTLYLSTMVADPLDTSTLGTGTTTQ